jgi:hypothetical protein
MHSANLFSRFKILHSILFVSITQCFPIGDSSTVNDFRHKSHSHEKSPEHEGDGKGLAVSILAPAAQAAAVEAVKQVGGIDWFNKREVANLEGKVEQLRNEVFDEKQIRVKDAIAGMKIAE